MSAAAERACRALMPAIGSVCKAMPGWHWGFVPVLFEFGNEDDALSRRN